MSYEFRMENAETIEKLHESLYLVYYNCYFNKHVSDFAPNWINTEQLIEDQESICREKKRNSELLSMERYIF
jgi:hypothetical protein